MRQFLHFFAAALVGGILAAAIVLVVVQDRMTPPNLAPVHNATAPAAAPLNTPVYLTNYRASGESETILPDLRSAARKATPAAVHITAFPENLPIDAVKRLFSNREDRPPLSDGEGSGVFYNGKGYIVTNYHVVKGAAELVVRTNDRKTYAATLVGQDPKSDLAVIKIEGSGFPYLTIADSDAVQPGEWVLAVGNPLGLTSTVTAGIVSAKGRNISLLRDLDAIESFIQTDAAVNPGNSGGPLVTADGKLLGINTAIASETGRFQGYSFSIPSNLVKRVVDDIIEFGTYRRAFLGVSISTLTDNDIRRLNLTNRNEGVLIDEILPNGSAEAAGLKVDDIVIRVGDRTIRDLPELTEIIGRAKVGDTLKVTVVRNGTARELIVSMSGAPQ